jgi:UDP-galactopyranose mutase
VTRDHVAVVVLGAGPCGIGCVRELDRLGAASPDRVVVLEAADRAGGLGASVVDAAGFTWDRGGHVVFSHYGEFDRLLLEVLGDDVLRHDRSSWVLADGAWVPYPFQNNLHRLGPEGAHECLVGMIEAARGGGRDAAAGAGAAGSGVDGEMSFAAWIQATFGPGVAGRFLTPYNTKVWATDPAAMGAGWIAERVSVSDWRTVLGNTLAGRDDLAWGPNNRFSFPATGGTGEIWARAAAPLAPLIRYGVAVERVHAGERWVEAGGQRTSFDHLVTTLPLDRLVAATVDAPDHVREAAAALVHNTVHVVGVGVEAPLTDDRSWLYFPDPEVPFYRATNFAKYAPANVPGSDTDRYSSWMCEVASSATHPRRLDRLGDEVVDALRRTGLVADDAAIASLHVEELPYAYPVPTLGRDAALAVIQPWLDARGIYARGRFGTWRYEIGNMDHAVKMGIDVARRIVSGTPEELV